MSSSKKRAKPARLDSDDESSSDSSSSVESEVVMSSKKTTPKANSSSAKKKKTSSAKGSEKKSALGKQTSNSEAEVRSVQVRPYSFRKKPWQVEQDKEEPLGNCVATVEVLSSEAWEEVSKQLASSNQGVASPITVSSLRPALSLRVGKVKFLRQKSAPNIWAAFMEHDEQFVAQLVLFGLCWRIEGAATNRSLLSKQDGIQTIKFDLSDYQVYREEAPCPDQSHAKWVKVAPSNLGIAVEPSTRVVVQYQLNEKGQSPTRG